ncbi:zf-HC2 domain-containing protein [Corynebacterium xerosis]|uniref:zf-HC2 domain-containing protein n=1 Tax=Corynebacterium xerosis TaxID=1725 RepID=UPI000EB502EC|nr:zf-HC2 domain-containing protein [Corynebacterium xerosis]AYJ32759.1 zf-HC2 domain-containing protein [Corynebacterium xerosis]
MASPHHDFASTDHLGVEAVAAFVDGELGPTAHRRAQAHLLACGECRREVARQRQAARRLRDSGELHIPEGLRERLASLSRDQMPEDAPGARSLSHRRPDSFAAFIESAWRTIRKTGNGQ